MNNFVIIIPAYNESERISSTIAGIRKITDTDIIVVDDGSPDNTSVAAWQVGATVLALPFNLGYGAALQTGYRFVLDKGYDFAVQMDADGQHDPAYIVPLLKEVMSGACDVAIGSRFLGEGQYRTPLIRKIGILLFRNIASFITGQRVTDPTSGFQALGRKAMTFYASDAFPVDFPDADVLIMLYKKGLRFMEVPVKMLPNPKRITMHSGIIPVYYAFKMILSIFVTLLRKH